MTDVRDTNPSRDIDTPRDTDVPRVIDTPRDINAPRVINAPQDVHIPRDSTAVRRTGVANPLRSLRLHSRPHIDLQRVAGALCCS
ncbi:putative leader peptide [Streptomyces bobili]|uniref:putative leader peptide n=1 Tax=Streptomyces bobili TaxID=67280 RepID=UPI00342338E3